MKVEKGVLDFLLRALHPSKLKGGLHLPHFSTRQWNTFFDLAHQLDIELPVYLAVSQGRGNGRLERWVRSKLSATIGRLQDRIRGIEGELVRVGSILGQSKVDFAPLGPIDWVWRFYPKKGIRTLSEVSIVTRREQFKLALSRLGPGGYRLKRLISETELVLERAKVPVRIRSELYGRRRETEEVWDRSHYFQFGRDGTRGAVLSPEDTLIHMLYSLGEKRGLASPVWMNDLDFFLKASPKFDTDLVWTELSKMGTARLASDLLNLVAKERGRELFNEQMRAQISKNLGWLRSKLGFKTRIKYAIGHTQTIAPS